MSTEKNTGNDEVEGSASDNKNGVAQKPLPGVAFIEASLQSDNDKYAASNHRKHNDDDKRHESVKENVLQKNNKSGD